MTHETMRLLKIFSLNLAKLFGFISAVVGWVFIVSYLPNTLWQVIAGLMPSLLFFVWLIWDMSKSQLAIKMLQEKQIADALARED